MSIQEKYQEPTPQAYPKTGSIPNEQGQECRYTQTYSKDDPYFMPKGMKHTEGHKLRTIEFLTPNHMLDSHENKKKILERIAKSSHSDLVQEWVKYDTDHLYAPGEFQGHGHCFMDPNAPLASSIAIEFKTKDGKITHVIYARTPDCRKTKEKT